ncbi:Obg ATPase 1 [Phytophthora cinnamomi]|uniref:Obg ATPase 1 n=1 Tax=Phytophthora cinnamomi TaxID=4785 RepID=UPI00355A2588|nr:Obg ATPase 1 [Phytophthora cinnamomi]
MLLRSMLKQKSSWRLQLQRILDFEASSVSHEPQVHGISEVEIEIMDEAQAAQEFGFHPLTEQDLTQTILDNKRDISHVEHRLLLSSAPESTNDVRTHRMQAFGWDVVQRVHGGVMEFACTKRFHGLNMLDVMQKTWANGMRLDDFKKVKAETRRLQALQRINSNAYVFARDVFSPSDISTFRSVFVRFLAPKV